MVHLQDYNEPAPSRMPFLIAVMFIVAAVGGVLWWRHDAAASRPVASTPPSSVPAVPPHGVAPPVSRTPAATAPVAASAASANLPAVASGPVPPAVLAEAESMEKAGRLVDARLKYLDILEAYPGASGVSAVEERAAALGMELLFKPHPMPEKAEYVVGAGDTLDKIARQFGCTKELLLTNNLIAKASLIKRGDHYRVFNGRFKVTVNKTRHDLLLTMNGRFFKRYAIGTGKFGKTPAGTFTLSERIAQPVWWKPDGKAVPFGSPDNILGTHWLALKASGATPAVSGYGIHGTWDDASIGKAESAGCVRMHNADVEQLYTLLPIGTEVVIVE